MRKPKEINLIILLLVIFSNCVRIKSNNSINYVLPDKQAIPYRDSLYVLFTFKEYSRLNWYIYNDYSKMYAIRNNEIDYFIEEVFFNPYHNKIIVWVSEKMFNAPTLKRYSKTNQFNRICPVGKDTIFNLYVLIGFKDSSKIWQLYPLENMQANCFSSRDSARKVLEQYFFSDMKSSEILRVVQTGTKKGILEMCAYKHTLLDKDFWDDCWLWKKDTVGSNDLYPFQIKAYGYGKIDTCFKCAEPLLLPRISYPDTLLNLFR